jgi:hypothetical protein
MKSLQKTILIIAAALTISPSETTTAAAAAASNNVASSQQQLGPRRRKAILPNKRTSLVGAPSAQVNVATLSTRGGGGVTTPTNAIAGALVMTMIERGIFYLLKANGSKLPAQLGGCIALFLFLLVADVVRPGLGQSIFVSLSPGSALLAKWLPVFFVPGLAMLPLAPSVGSGTEVSLLFIKVAVDSVLVCGKSVHYSVCTSNHPEKNRSTRFVGGQSTCCRYNWFLIFHLDRGSIRFVLESGTRKTCPSDDDYDSVHEEGGQHQKTKGWQSSGSSNGSPPGKTIFCRDGLVSHQGIGCGRCR